MLSRPFFIIYSHLGDIVGKNIAKMWKKDTICNINTERKKLLNICQDFENEASVDNNFLL